MKRILLLSSILIFLMIGVLYPGFIINGVTKGLIIWCNKLIPTLFPFLILCSYGQPYFLQLSKVSCRVYIMISGLLCGYPVGAKCSTDLKVAGYLSELKFNLYASLFNQASPMFLSGFVLYRLSLSFAEKIVCFVSFYGAILILYIIIKISSYNLASKISPLKDKTNASNHMGVHRITIDTEKHIEPVPLDTCIQNSITLILKLGTYVILFTLIFDALFFTAQYLPSFIVKLIPFIELTNGVIYIQNSSMPLYQKTGILLCLSAFGGGCVTAQTKSITDTCHLSWKYYMLIKLSQMIVTYLLFKILIIIFIVI